MELQNTDGVSAAKQNNRYEVLAFENSLIVFLHKPMKNKSKKVVQTYCSVLIKIFGSSEGFFPAAEENNIDFFNFNEMKKTAYDELLPGQKMVRGPDASVKNKNGIKYAKVTYQRTGDNGDVVVNIYYLYNRYKAVKLITSYRLSDAKLWQDVATNVFESFQWDKIYHQPSTMNTSNTNGKTSNSNYALMVLLTIAFVIILIIAVKSETNSNKYTYNNYNHSDKQSTSPKNVSPNKPQIVKNEPKKTNVKPKTKENKSVDLEKYNKKLIFVNYTISDKFDNDYYPIVKIPKKGSIVFPHRNNKAQRRGFTEVDFETKLRKSFPLDCNYAVSGDVCILPPHFDRPYEPDIAIIEKSNKYGIRIDIEIDEPYSGVDKKPIHFIDCGDEFRDRVFNALGWIVIRFSERQIFRESENCIAFIQHILTLIDNDFQLTVPKNEPSPEKRWTETEAKTMIVEKSRENLLKHDFDIIESDFDKHKDLTPNELEKQALQYYEPVELPKENYTNIDGSTNRFKYDSKLAFEPREHIYSYDGKLLTPVSDVVGLFFNEFDSIGISERQSGGDIQRQIELIETWESKGTMARQVGTQLHLAIENYFKNLQMPDSYHFEYSGRYVHINTSVSIKKEIGYFKNFLKDNPNLKPFRTEWRICDLKYDIAGSIDFICRNGDGFDMYDWKRSKRSSPYESSYNKHGKNGLEAVPDISYWHYALQQNLYRYILRENYGITVNKMNIVILHPDFSNYIVYEIPQMDSEIKIMLTHLKSLQK